MKTKTVAFLTLAALLAAVAIVVIGCGEGDGITEDGATVTVPLLPVGLPLLPTDVTLDGLVSYVEDFVDDNNLDFFGLLDNDDIRDFLDDVEDRLRKASLEALQPGVLSGGVNNSFLSLVSDFVKITNVGMTFAFRNETDAWVDVPVEFQLFAGNGDLAEAWDESVMIPFVDERVDEDGQFIVKPGESIELTVESIPQLADALNAALADGAPLGIGYKALYRMADVENDADPVEAIKEFGPCLISGLLSGSTSGCPDIEELLGWHLTIEKFEVHLTVDADFDLGDLPSCDEFTSSLGLDDLNEACP
jgi:hypothetical protein